MGRAWILAPSLMRLREQLAVLAPHRSTASDGSIGDTNHLAEGWQASDHNPWWPTEGEPGVVRAIDITHDPAGGMDCNKLADALVAARDPRVLYIIWCSRIVDSRAIPRGGVLHAPWTWLPYDGSNPHDHHLHVSVVASPACRDTAPWVLSLTEQALVRARKDHPVTYRLAPTPVPGSASTDAAPDGTWPATEETISAPGPAGGWSGRIVMHLVFGFLGGFVQEAWSGPSGKHFVARYDPGAKSGGMKVSAFFPQIWELPAGDRFLVVRYAARNAGSIGIETQN